MLLQKRDERVVDVDVFLRRSVVEDQRKFLVVVDLGIYLKGQGLNLKGHTHSLEILFGLYLEDDQYPQCVQAANNALNKGGLKKRQNVYVVRGMCLFNQDSLDDARGSFVSCRNESRKDKDNTNQRICAQWITFIDNEKTRLQALADAS